MRLNELLTLKGVGKKTVEHLHKAGLFTFEHIVARYPVRYDQQYLSSLEAIHEQYGYVQAQVISRPKMAYIKKNMQILSFRVKLEDKTFLVKVYNQRFLMKVLMSQPLVVIYGKLKKSELQAQRVLLADNFEEGIFPIYNIEGLTDKSYGKIVDQVFGLLPSFKEIYPNDLIDAYDLMPRNVFVKAMHKPNDVDMLEAAVRRFKYQEMFRYLTKVAWKKYLSISVEKQPKAYNKLSLRQFVLSLPFKLTKEQEKAMNDILNDFTSTAVMNRMLQGDTGSGKTVVALFAMVATMSASQQAAFLAPTEILAHQHFETCQKLLKSSGFEVRLLTGSMSTTEKKEIYAGLKSGRIAGVVGTHSLFSEAVQYKNLGLVITDEQHRFGVNQRQLLKQKGTAVDVLYLSATPIPRTLAMTLYGDMTMSTLRSKPGIRLSVETFIMSSKDKDLIRQAMQETLKKNEQIYVVAPTIETNEQMHLFGVTTLFDVIKKRYSDARVGLLHAKLDYEEKQKVLKDFKAGNIDILVSTTVIEVGIDIPNATLMIIYHAERFGYAQLHQLRGRVGRSDKRAKCFMITDGGDEVLSRLGVLESVFDGFELSELDLKQRGFGDLAGTLQSGRLDLNDFLEMTDITMLEDLKKIAEKTVEAYEKDAQYGSLMKLIMQEMEDSAFVFLKDRE